MVSSFATLHCFGLCSFPYQADWYSTQYCLALGVFVDPRRDKSLMWRLMPGLEMTCHEWCKRSCNTDYSISSKTSSQTHGKWQLLSPWFHFMKLGQCEARPFKFHQVCFLFIFIYSFIFSFSSALTLYIIEPAQVYNKCALAHHE